MKLLENMEIAILATDGFEEVKLFEPKRVLEANGAQVHIATPAKREIKAWKDGNRSKIIAVGVPVNRANENEYEYDALVIPGRFINPNKLRRNSEKET